MAKVKSTEAVNNSETNLVKTWEGLKRLDKDFNVGYLDFKQDMQDPSVRAQLHESLVRDFKDKGFKMSLEEFETVNGFEPSKKKDSSVLSDKSAKQSPEQSSGFSAKEEISNKPPYGLSPKELDEVESEVINIDPKYAIPPRPEGRDGSVLEQRDQLELAGLGEITVKADAETAKAREIDDTPLEDRYKEFGVNQEAMKNIVDQVDGTNKSIQEKVDKLKEYDEYLEQLDPSKIKTEEEKDQYNKLVDTRNSLVEEIQTLDEFAQKGKSEYETAQSRNKAISKSQDYEEFYKDQELKKLDTGQSRIMSAISEIDRGFYGTFLKDVPRTINNIQAYAQNLPTRAAKDLLGVMGADREQLEKDFPDVKPEEMLGYTIADGYDKIAEQLFPTNPAFQEEFLASQLPQGAGNLAAYAIAGGLRIPKSGMTTEASKTVAKRMGNVEVGKDLVMQNPTSLKILNKEIGKLVSNKASQLGVAQIMATTYADAKEKGKSDDEAFMISLLDGSVGGLSEGIPISLAFNRINKATKGSVVKYLKDAGKDAFSGGAEEGLQEIFQQAYSNTIALEYYDDTREIVEGLKEGGSVGFVLGFAMNGIIGSLRAKKMYARDKAEIADLNKAIALLESEFDELNAPIDLVEVKKVERVEPRRNLTKEEKQGLEEKYNITIEDNIKGLPEITANDKSKKGLLMLEVAKSEIDKLTTTQSTDTNTSKSDQGVEVNEVVEDTNVPNTESTPETVEQIESDRKAAFNKHYNNLVAGNVLDNQKEPVYEEDKGIGANDLSSLTKKKFGHGHIRTSGLNSLGVLEKLLNGADFSGMFGKIGRGAYTAWETGKFIIVSNNIDPTTNKKLNLNEIEIILNAGLSIFAQELANKYPNVIFKDFNGKKYDAELKALEENKEGDKAEVATAEKSVVTEPEIKSEEVVDEDGVIEHTVGKKSYKLKKEGGDIEVLDDGKVASKSVRQKVLKDYKDKYDYTEGQESDKSVEPTNIATHISDTSENPSEIAQIWKEVKDTQGDMLPNKERVLAEVLPGNVKTSSFEMFGDKNNKGMTMARAYLNKNARPLDVILQEASEKAGVEITPDEAIEFIRKYPSPPSLRIKGKDQVALETKFREITGFDINDDVADLAIAQRQANVTIEDAKMPDVDEFIINEINERGITLETLPTIKEQLFSGFPFTQEDYEAVRQQLEEKQSQESSTESTPIGKQVEEQTGEQVKETFEKAVANKALRKSTTDENIQALREKRFGKEGANTNNDKVANSLSKFGWTSRQEGGDVVIQNAKGKDVAIVKFDKKGESYTITDTIGTKLLSGRGKIEESVESVAKDYFYAKEKTEKPSAKEQATIAEKAPESKKVEVKEQPKVNKEQEKPTDTPVVKRLKEDPELRKSVAQESLPSFLFKNKDKFKSQEEAKNFYFEARESLAQLAAEEGARKQFSDKGRSKKATNTAKGMLDKVQKAFPGIKVVIDENPTPPKGARMMASKSGEVFGYFDPTSGEVHLTESVMTAETALEEFAHVWVHLAKYSNKAVYNKGIAEAKKTPLFQELKETYPELSEQDLAEEAFGQIIRDAGMNQKTGWKAVLKDFWQAIKAALGKIGIKIPTTVNINTVTLDQLAEIASRELLSETPISYVTSDQIAKLAENSMAFRVNDVIEQGLLKGQPKGYYYEKMQPWLRKNFLTHKGAGENWKNTVNKKNFVLSKVTQDANFAVRALKAEVKKVLDSNEVIKSISDKRTRKDAKEAYATELLQNIDKAFKGEYDVNLLPEAIAEKVKDVRAKVDELTKEIVRNKVALGDDIIVGINENLEVYLSTNYKSVEQYQQQVEARRRASDQRLNSIAAMSRDELVQEVDKINTEIARVNEGLKDRKLADLKAAIKILQNQKDRGFDPAIKKQLVVMRDLLEKHQGGVATPNKRSKMTEAQKARNKKIREAREALKKLQSQEKKYSEEEILWLDEIAAIQEVIESSGQISLDEMNDGQLRNYAQDMANKAHRLNNKLKESEQMDLAAKEVEFDLVDDVFDIKIVHANGTKTEFSGLPYDVVKSLFGDAMAKRMLNEQSGVNTLSDPKILANNTLYERMMDNMGKYVTRSYMAYDIPNFADNFREIIGEEHYLEAYEFISSQYKDGRVKSLTVEKTKNGELAIQFTNALGVQSEILYYPNMNSLKESQGGFIKDSDIKDIANQLKMSDNVNFSLPQTTRPQSNVGFRLTPEQVDALMKDVVSKNGIKRMYSGVPIKGLDTGIFKKKGDIADPIRKLLGEYTNPYINISKTIVKASMAIEANRFANEVVSVGEGGQVSKERTALHTMEVTPEVLFGLKESVYMTPEAYNVLFPDNKGQQDALIQTLVFFSGMTKAALTIYSPASQTRNFFGAALNLIGTGTANFANLKYAAAVSSQNFTKAQSRATLMSIPLFTLRLIVGKSFGFDGKGGRGKYAKQSLIDAHLELIEQGVIQEQLDANILEDLNEYIGKSTIGTAYKNVTETFAEPYQLSDNVFKTLQYLKEKEVFKKAYPDKTDAEIRTLAGQRVREEQPTYSELPDAVRKLARFPLVGTFVTWNTAMIKTSANILTHAATDIRGDNKVLRERGFHKLFGFTASMLIGLGMHELFKHIYNWGDDEDEAVSGLSPTYARNDKRVYISPDKKMVQSISLTFIDPKSMFYKPVVAVMRGEGASGAIDEVADPYISQDIFIQAAMEAYNGEDQYGRKLFNTYDPNYVKAMKSTQHVIEKALAPKAIDTGVKLGRAALNIQPEDGRVFTLDQELSNIMFGVKSRTVDMKKAFKAKMKASYYDMTDAKSEYRRKGQSLDYFNKYSEARYNEMKSYVQDMKTLGFTKSEIYVMLRDFSINKNIMNKLHLGSPYPGWNENLNDYNP